MSSGTARRRGGSPRRTKDRTYTSAASPPEAQDKAEALNPHLLSAAQRVLIESLLNADDVGHWADAADELASLTLAVQAAAADQDPKLEGGTTPDLRRNLLKLLEDELLRDSSSDHGAEDAVVSATGNLRHALEPHGDAAVNHLSSPDAGELLAEIAHDLRSPLTSILTLSEALGRGQSGAVNEIQRRQLGLIYNAALALSSTASDLIELAHGGDRLAQKEPSPFSLTEMLDSIRDMVCPMAEEKGLTLSFTTDVSDRRLGYPLALSRVLLNLVTNALKFTEEGGVEISAHAMGPIDIDFAVRDTGKGIDSSAMATLYQPFRRAAGRGGYCFSGTGLGLVICRRLIAAMGSELQLETRPGRGTRFHFRVKLPPANPLV